MTPTPERITEITKAIVKKSFFNYFHCREEVGTKHIVLSRFFPEESVIRSAIGGIETSLGSFWEKIAIAIAKENGFEILDPKNDFKEPKTIPESISRLLDQHKYQRELAGANIPMAQYVSALNQAINELPTNQIPTEYKKLGKGTGVDIYIRKGSHEYAFESKTVQINAGSGPKFNETLMKWATFRALHQKYLGTNNTFHPHLVIPYDPNITSNWWTEFSGRAYPLDHVDLKLGDEFWDFISGCSNTLLAITKAFDELTAENFPTIYKSSIYGAGARESIHIVESTCGVICTTPEQEIPSNFTSNLSWKCNECSGVFSKSIKWFGAFHPCPNCGTQLFK